MAKYRDLFIGRWVGLMLAFVFLVALLAPSGAVARVEYTNDTSGMEGDPGDGLGASGGTVDPPDLMDQGSDNVVWLPLALSSGTMVTIPISGVTCFDAHVMQIWFANFIVGQTSDTACSGGRK